MTTELMTPPPVDMQIIDREDVPERRSRSGGVARKLLRGKPDDPRWVRPVLLTLLAGTALLYLWGLGASGWANSYYSAAVQAGTRSWKAFFFGSFDSANAITIDKSPASLWVMEISARVFGVSSWSILVPQALEGVAAVGVLYLTVRRWFTPAAGLIAGAILAVSPAAVLMFRFNNPDALLVLLLTLGAYALTRAVENGETKWVVLAFSFVGFGFLAKMLQALLVVPVFALVYAIAAPPRLWRRIGQLVLGGTALLASAGWWVAIVELWPAGSRPYIGGSQNNSLLNLIFGYNGFGRLTGNETGSVGGRGPQGSMWGPTGLSRLFKSDWGGQISWLLPAALFLLVATLVVTWNRPRTDRTRAAMLLWGGSLVVTALAFSLGQGIIHQYYSVALAPLIGAVVGIGVATFWRRRDRLVARAVLAAALALSVGWSYALLDRTPNWYPSLRTIVLVGGLAAGVLLVMIPGTRRRALTMTALSAGLVSLVGTSAYALSTALATHRGAIPLAGPSAASRPGFGGGPPAGFDGGPAVNGGPPTGLAGGTPPGFGATGGSPDFPPNGAGTSQPGAGGLGGATGGGGGGLLDAGTPSTTMVELLRKDSDRYQWVAAAIGANNAAGYQLATGEAVMAIGGFNGSDPWPSLTQFQQYVRDGKIHFFIGGGGFGGGGPGGASDGSGTGSRISAWVASHFSSRTVGGLTVYDLTKAKATTAS